MGPAAALTIEFDFDDDGFFAPQDRRDLLQAAGDYVGGRLTDSLTVIDSSGPYDFFPGYSDPDAGFVYDAARTIPEDTLVIYTGGRDLSEGVAGEGGPGGYKTSPATQEWLNNASNRGQVGDTGLSSTSTDIGPWGGAIWFANDGINWHFDADPLSLEPFSGIDFFSVAIHEIAHVLGFGTAPSWNRLVGEDGFSGPQAVAAHGGDVALSGDDAHWQEGTRSTVAGTSQEAAMDPDINAGTRKFFTELDWAALADMGWEVQAPDGVAGVEISPVPLPASVWLMVTALAGLGMLGRRRSRNLTAA